MNKNHLKITTIFIIIVFFGSPLLSAYQNIIVTKENTTNPVQCLKINIDPDPKIVEAIEMINESYLYEILYELCVKIGPRRTGTYGCEEAEKYLFNEFKDMGLNTITQSFKHLTKKLKLYQSNNIEATLQGKRDISDEIIIFNAHYDSVKVSPGAVDDGTGVAAVVATANALSHFDFNRTIKFVLFSGEEVGLLGSRAYVREIYKNGTDVFVELNADMVGYANENESHTVRLSRTIDVDWIVDEIRNVNKIYDIGVNVSSVWNFSAEDERGYSDYWDFLLHGYECVAFWESGGYQYAHTPYDTIEKVNFSYLANVTKLILATIAHIADIDVYYPQISIQNPKRGRSYYEDLTIRKYRYERTLVINDVLICTKIKVGSVPIEKVEFYYDGKLMFTDTEEPYQYRLNEFSIIRKHAVKVILYDELGRTAQDKVKFRYINIRLNK